ncbi:hypothetical protein HPB51_026586 [Rhipicephalus microplus]|uniref:Transposable element n=1 Tax=Rhipicephalus microplus TaxID=6941 RepID=A0A9J6D2N9_RHIMP|nr:hypothetical protein HPB51_026586 [Rhipicephalus microplus]
MNVRLATPLFNRSVAIGLMFYREQKTPGFADTRGTEEFTLVLNNLFDALNARIPVEGIRQNSRQIQVIRELLEMLNSTEKSSKEDNTKMFASQMSVEFLRVTLMPVLDVIDLLHKQGVPYLLMVKLNQDPLELFYCVVRTFGGNEDHPTITNFSQVFHLLSLHTPLKMATKGNCTGEDNPVLISLEETLSNMKMSALLEKEARNEKLQSLLASVNLEECPEGATEDSYSRAAPKGAVLYYLAGYVVKKAMKFFECVECRATITDTQSVPAASVLTEARSFVSGALKHPLKSLTELLGAVELLGNIRHSPYRGRAAEEYVTVLRYGGAI